ncbi:MAG: glycosyl transferase family 2 [Desulfobulbaceae bacterium A2]|nr:MAG: glycosyl transferase family 2 [Desulfobulbaceae bacterium A2]
MIKSLIKILSFYYKNHNSTYEAIASLLGKAMETLKVSGLRGLFNKVIFSVNHGDSNKLYNEWIRINERNFSDVEIGKILNEIQLKPVISIIVPVYNASESLLSSCIDSVVHQSYPYWELCIADDASSEPHVRTVLEQYEKRDDRIKVVYRKVNGHISEASNSAIALASGEYIALLDNDDELSRDALLHNAILINHHPEADMIYSDEDKMMVNGKRCMPYFKPDWSPDTMLSQMYTCHLGVYRTRLVREIGGFRKGFEGSQDYDLVLRLTEKTSNVYHIPKILYHWKMHSSSTAMLASTKNYAFDAACTALNEALHRRGEGGRAEKIPGFFGRYKVRYPLASRPRISIILPTRDLAEVLATCIGSIFEKSTYENFEVLIADNGSVAEETFKLFAHWQKKEPERFRVISCDMPFNYSRINNACVQHASGELLLLLNNDTEVITPDWLEEMAGQAMRPTIGAVGARLLYPEQTIQHSGIIVGIIGVAGHGHKHFHKDNPGYHCHLAITANYAAVTGACLMVKKSLYDQLGGLDEHLGIAYNDVDFCLKLLELGLYNVVVADVSLYHHESKSRGYEETSEKMRRLGVESAYMKAKWDKYMRHDPFYSPNLTRVKEDYSVRQ